MMSLLRLLGAALLGFASAVAAHASTPPAPSASGAQDALVEQTLARLAVDSVRSATGNMDCLEPIEVTWPVGRRNWRGAVVDVEYTQRAGGYTSDYAIYRDSGRPFAEAAIEYLRRCRFEPSDSDQAGLRFRVVFQTVGGTTTRQTTELLNDLRHEAVNGSRGRKAMYAYTLELATAFDDVPRWAESTEWYLKAASEGNPRSMFEIGSRLLYGWRGFLRDRELGVAWLQRSADAAYGPAAWLLSQRIEPDPVTAKERLAQAAESGHPPAQLALAEQLLAEGDDVRQAASWLRKARNAYDRLRWLEVAAKVELARGRASRAAKHLSEGRELAVEAGYPLQVWDDLQALVDAA